MIRSISDLRVDLICSVFRLMFEVNETQKGCVCFMCQIIHWGGAAEEDGLEGGSGCGASCEEESPSAEDRFVFNFSCPELKCLFVSRICAVFREKGS